MKTEGITAISFLAYFSDRSMADRGQQHDLVVPCGVSWDLEDKRRVYDVKLEVAVVTVKAILPSTSVCAEGCI